MLSRARLKRHLGVLAGLAALTLYGVFILGYHPYAEDGGLYLAEVKRLLFSGMYPQQSAFVSGHLSTLVFPSSVAWIVRVSGLSLPTVALTLHVLCVFATLLAVWQIAEVCYQETAARWGAVAVVAACLITPIAGTSLLLMDPYLTARSLSTPLVLLGTAGILRFARSRHFVVLAWSAALFAVAAGIHPLMTGYGIWQALLLLCLLDQRRSIKILAALFAAMGAIIAAAALQTVSPGESAEYVRIAMTRQYWFLGNWRWFEWLGLVAPLAILATVAISRCAGQMVRRLALMASITGMTSVVIALLFAQVSGHTHLVARMQPLRAFQMVYVVMMILLGATLGRLAARYPFWRPALAFTLLGGAMLMVDRITYPSSDHMEMPGSGSKNQWVNAFQWVSLNTPADAVFALDADYVRLPGEDAQGFRAWAERSALPDYSKDGGEASVRPELTSAWVTGQRAQAGLTTENDASRIEALRGSGASWLILGQNGRTAFACPYENAAVKVCRLPTRENSHEESAE